MRSWMGVTDDCLESTPEPESRVEGKRVTRCYNVKCIEGLLYRLTVLITKNAYNVRAIITYLFLYYVTGYMT